jgi:type II secretory pathway pseudopilin PulG
VLATIVLSSLGEARIRANDAKKRTLINQLATATEIYYLDNNSYPASTGWINTNDFIIPLLVPEYISAIDVEVPVIMQYWRKDYRGHGCLTEGTAEQMAFYVQLENPTAADLSTMTNPFDVCVSNKWGINFKAGTQ